MDEIILMKYLNVYSDLGQSAKLANQPTVQCIIRQIHSLSNINLTLAALLYDHLYTTTHQVKINQIIK